LDESGFNYVKNPVLVVLLNNQYGVDVG
jgi:hypothetical protein